LSSKLAKTYHLIPGYKSPRQFSTTPQAPLKNRVVKIPQGKVLGGSSATNGMAFIAPLPGAIDAWSELGATGWNWDNLKGYYKKSYTLQLPDVETRRHIGVDWADEDGFEIGEGPLRASFPAVKENPLAKAWIETFQAIGFGAQGDPFEEASLGGYSNLALTDMATKTRSHAAGAYGVSAVERGVRILTEAVVRRVLFEGSFSSEEGVVASGVEVVINGQVQRINAKKEVLLCAGAINTPKILELSGIGDEERLRNLDIPVIINNPNVGENLQDHLSTGISFEAIDGVVTLDPLLRQEPEAIQSAMQQYTESKTGPMTIGGIQSSAFMPLIDFHASNKKRKSTMQEFIDPYLSTTAPDPRNSAIRNVLSKPDSPACMMFMFLAQGSLHDHENSAFSGDSLQQGNFITLGFETNFSFSRGNTHITSSNPDTKPSLNPAYLTHPLDLDLMAYTLLDVHSLHKLPPLSSYLIPDGRRNHPDAFLSDLDSAKKYLLDTVNTTYHYCGTAAMLPREEGGVVDEDLRVYGMRNLRICDASVFPLIPAANIQSTVYAVAERGADIIKGVI
jgi:choline dehydrogenase-like flavoprotein